MTVMGLNSQKAGFTCGLTIAIFFCLIVATGVVFLIQNTWRTTLEHVREENEMTLFEMYDLFDDEIAMAEKLATLFREAGQEDLCEALSTAAANETINITSGLNRTMTGWLDILAANFVHGIELQYLKANGDEPIEISRTDFFQGDDFSLRCDARPNMSDARETHPAEYAAFAAGKITPEHIYASHMRLFRHDGCLITPNIPSITFTTGECGGFIAFTLSFARLLEHLKNASRSFHGDAREADSNLVMLISDDGDYYLHSRNSSKEWEFDRGLAVSFVDDWGDELFAKLVAMIEDEDQIGAYIHEDKMHFLTHVVDVGTNEQAGQHEELIFIVGWDSAIVTGIAGVSIMFYVLVCYACFVVAMFAVLVGHLFQVGARNGMETYIKLVFVLRHFASILLCIVVPIMTWVVRNPTIDNELRPLWVPLLITGICVCAVIYHLSFLNQFFKVMNQTVKMLRRLAPFQIANAIYTTVIIITNLALSWKLNWSLGGFVMVETLLFASMHIAFYVIYAAGDKTASKGSRGSATGKVSSTRSTKGATPGWTSVEQSISLTSISGSYEDPDEEEGGKAEPLEKRKKKKKKQKQKKDESKKTKSEPEDPAGG